jgi:hypothetical protein
VQKKGRIIFASITAIFVAIVVASVAWAEFTGKNKVLGSNFRTGSAEVKLLENLSGGTDSSNLKSELPGPVFLGIIPNWSSDYLMKIFNNGSSTLQLTSNSYYDTINDPDDLRTYIFVEPFEWDDTNNNGTVDTGEEGVSFGKKSITKWKTEGFDFGTLAQGEVKGFILRFSTAALSDTKQGKSAIFDFEFNSLQQ